VTGLLIDLLEQLVKSLRESLADNVVVDGAQLVPNPFLDNPPIEGSREYLWSSLSLIR
jgi:hypothetical protein